MMQSPRDRISMEKKLCIKTLPRDISILAIKEARSKWQRDLGSKHRNVEEKLEKSGFPGSQARKRLWREKS